MELLRAGEYHNTPDNIGLLQAIREVLEVRRAVVSYGWRDVKVRYIHTYLGWGWLLLPAVLLLAPVLLVQLRFEAVNENFSLWISAISGHILSVALIQQIAPLWINNKNVLLKIRLPILFMPVSRLVVLLPEWILYTTIVVGSGIYLESAVENIFLQWFVVQLFVVFGFSVGLILCAFSSRLRDVIHAVPVVMQGQLLLVVIYLIKGFDLQGFNWIEWLPPILFINILKSSHFSMSAAVIAFGSLLFALLSAYLYVKFSKNALERI